MNLIEKANGVCTRCKANEKNPQSWRAGPDDEPICLACFNELKGGYYTQGNRADYHREYQRKRRDELLPKDRVCPCCGEVKLKSRQWTVLSHIQLRELQIQHGNAASMVLSAKCVCVSCLRSGFPLKVEPVTMTPTTHAGGTSLYIKAILENDGVDPLTNTAVFKVLYPFEVLLADEDVAGIALWEDGELTEEGVRFLEDYDHRVGEYYNTFERTWVTE